MAIVRRRGECAECTRYTAGHVLASPLLDRQIRFYGLARSTTHLPGTPVIDRPARSAFFSPAKNPRCNPAHMACHKCYNSTWLIDSFRLVLIYLENRGLFANQTPRDRIYNEIPWPRGEIPARPRPNFNLRHNIRT